MRGVSTDDSLFRVEKILFVVAICNYRPTFLRDSGITLCIHTQGTRSSKDSLRTVSNRQTFDPTIDTPCRRLGRVRVFGHRVTKVSYPRNACQPVERQANEMCRSNRVGRP